MLVVAVVAALAGNSRTKVLVGTVARGPIPGPPSVGSCITGPYDYSSLASSDSGQPGYATAQAGPCAGEHYGEVVAIIPGGLDYRPEFDPSSQDEPDPDDPWTPCWSEVSSFFGYETDPMESMPRDRWWPTVSVGPELFAPNEMQREDGQRWLACVAIGISDGAAARYSGSLAGVMTTLRAPLPLAVCLDGVPSADEGGGIMAPCERPHLAEQFAAIYPDQDHPDPAPTASDCERLIRAMTGMPDPTAGGRLDITVTTVRERFYSGEAEDAEQFTGNSRYCLLVARNGVSLTGPLLGLGDDAVPIG